MNKKSYKAKVVIQATLMHFLIISMMLSICCILPIVSVNANSGLPGFTSAKAPTIDTVLDLDRTISGTAQSGLTVVVSYKSSKGSKTAEAVADEDDRFTVEIVGKLSAADEVTAYVKGLGTSEIMADSSVVAKKILPMRITMNNLKTKTTVIKGKTYPKARISLKYKGFSTTLRAGSNGKYSLKIPKKKRLKKGYIVRYRITYKNLTGLYISKKTI